MGCDFEGSASMGLLQSEIAKVLEICFASGVRPTSIIDQNRLRRAYRNSFGRELPNGILLEDLLRKVGLEHGGKIYPRPKCDETGWKALIEELIAKGHRIFMFSRVMALHMQELMLSGINSAEMLKTVICDRSIVEDSYPTLQGLNWAREWSQKTNKDFWVIKNWFAPLGEDLDFARIVSGGISKDEILLSEEDLQNRYPYVEPEEIHRLLCSDGRFIWNDAKHFAISARVVFDDKEINAALSWCRTEVDRDGFCSLARLNLPESMALNGTVSEAALRRVFAKRFLTFEFSLHGQIIARKGAQIDSKIPVREFCRAHSEVTLEQVRCLNAEFNIAEPASVVALHEEMVRVDADRFVSPTLVSFDVAGIDCAIRDYDDKRFRSLKRFKDFSSFPSVPGYVWNTYLLESFLRRASNVYALLTLSEGNLEPTGVLVQYRENNGRVPRIQLQAENQKFRSGLFVNVLARASLQEGLDPDAGIVGDFCIREGYIQRRSAKFINQVLAQMRALSMEKKG